MGQAEIVFMGYFEHAGGKGSSVFCCRRKSLKFLQKFLHPSETKGGTEPDRKDPAFPYGLPKALFGERTAVQIFLQQPLVPHRDLLWRRGKIHTAGIQLFPALLQDFRGRRGRKIAFVDKKKSRDPVPSEKAPYRFGMALHAGGGADHQDRRIQNVQRPFHFG